MTEEGSADCGDEITQTYRIDCNRYCEIVDLSVGGNVNGNIGTESREEFCTPHRIGGDACASKKIVKHIVPCPNPITYTLSASPSSVVSGETVTVNWTASWSRPTSDWIGLYRVGNPNTQYYSYQYISGGTSGSLTFTMPYTITAHEFRYFTVATIIKRQVTLLT